MAEPGQRARLPVSLHNGLLARLPVSRRSGLLACFPSTHHTLAQTAPADEKRDSWRHVNTHGFNKYLGSSFVQLCISSLSQIEEKHYVGIFVPYHVTMLSFMNFWSLLDFLKFKIQDSKQYHNVHHAINFQEIHLSCCIS